MKQATVYLGLGSNLSDRIANLTCGLELLSAQIIIKKVSSVYDTSPVGNIDQPRFLNLVCKGTTLLFPFDLLDFIKGVEKKLGRVPGRPRNSPRTVDIDILFYGDIVLDTPILVIPHPRLEERAFVLAPMADIAPGFIHPVSGKTAIRMLRELKRTTGDAVRTKINIQEQLPEKMIRKRNTGQEN